MSYNYTLKYRTFDQVLSDIHVDFQNLSLESMIEPQQLIKVVKRVNYDLGLRINKTKETLLEVTKGRVRLPDDFYVLNYALVCDEVSVTQGMPQGTWIEERPLITPYQVVAPPVDLCAPAVLCSTCSPSPCSCNSCSTCGLAPCSCISLVEPMQTVCTPTTDSCTKPRVILNCKNECFELVQIVNSGITRTYKRLSPIKILENPQMVDCGCPNLYWSCPYTAWIRDGWLYTNLDCAVIYISYQGQMEDDNGNLILPDHDMLNEYYEYAIKQRILENLVMNDEPVGQKLALVEQRLRASRNNALSIVNTPNFSEMKQVWAANRKAMYGKYYDMFKSYGPVPAIVPTNNFINGYNR